MATHSLLGSGNLESHSARSLCRIPACHVRRTYQTEEALLIRPSLRDTLLVRHRSYYPCQARPCLYVLLVSWQSSSIPSHIALFASHVRCTPSNGPEAPSRRAGLDRGRLIACFVVIVFPFNLR